MAASVTCTRLQRRSERQAKQGTTKGHTWRKSSSASSTRGSTCVCAPTTQLIECVRPASTVVCVYDTVPAVQQGTAQRRWTSRGARRVSEVRVA